eukprot:TRINITY_DN1161_c0_g1_i3.p5 TRINITY_DN1161_c0_g1~~TRINITY_DN1161_c0_g1_i3.p5  ORF type:complete len:133 (+),score=4.16 TRINITY_DN1161_c0_g1_i3:1342-1740(+)
MICFCEINHTSEAFQVTIKTQKYKNLDIKFRKRKKNVVVGNTLKNNYKLVICGIVNKKINNTFFYRLQNYSIRKDFVNVGIRLNQKDVEHNPNQHSSGLIIVFICLRTYGYLLLKTIALQLSDFSVCYNGII